MSRPSKLMLLILSVKQRYNVYMLYAHCTCTTVIESVVDDLHIIMSHLSGE